MSALKYALAAFLGIVGYHYLKLAASRFGHWWFWVRQH